MQKKVRLNTQPERVKMRWNSPEKKSRKREQLNVICSNPTQNTHTGAVQSGVYT
jgi:hypothetical protein